MKFLFYFWLFVSACSCASPSEHISQPHSKSLAFEHALGFGQYTQGGKGGKVYRVIRLKDDMEPGSLRHALMQKHPRIIEFDVSGLIELQKPLKVRYGYVSILGQTSPRGIAIVGAPVSIQAEQIIIRHVRFRLGTFGYQDDALTVRYSKDVIIDHCSFSWSTDETLSAYGNTNFTLQNSIIANSLNQSIHKKGAHGYGGIWGGAKASFINNLIANHHSRTPRLNGHRLKSPYPQADEYVELVNNVVFNWGRNNLYGSENGRFSAVNNFYVPGPDSKAKRFADLYYGDNTPIPQAHLSGNKYLGKSWLKDNLQAVIFRDEKEQKLSAKEHPQRFSNKILYTDKISYADKTRVASADLVPYLLQDVKIGARQTATSEHLDSVDRQVLSQLTKFIAKPAKYNKNASLLLNHETDQIASWQQYAKEFSQPQ